MPSSFRLEGADEMDRSLERIARVTSDPSKVNPVLCDALEPMAERARQIVPVRTGRLQSDIQTSDRADNANDGRLVAYVGPSVDAFYAEDVEFGRPANVSANGRQHGATKPHPFLRPAWDEESDQTIARVAAGLSDLIGKGA